MLEKWIEGVEKEINNSIATKNWGYKLMSEYGIYNDFFFYMDMTTNQRKSITQILPLGPHLNFLGEFVLYKDKFEEERDFISFGEESKDLENPQVNHYQFFFPKSTVRTLSENMVPLKENEIGYKFNSYMQLMLFGSTIKAAESLVYISKEFILPNKIPTYVNTSNCKNTEFQNFSVFIND